MTPKWQLFYYFLLVPVPKFPGRKGEGKIIGSCPPFPNHRGDKDAQQIIQPDIPPGHLVDPEQKERADLHRHKERQDGKKKGIVPDVQVEIEMKEKGKKQRQGKRE
jgi:hypothetical protein